MLLQGARDAGITVFVSSRPPRVAISRSRRTATHQPTRHTTAHELSALPTHRSALDLILIPPMFSIRKFPPAACLANLENLGRGRWRAFAPLNVIDGQTGYLLPPDCLFRQGKPTAPSWHAWEGL